MQTLQAGFETPFLVLALIILFSYTTQAITGFGSTVIALALGAQLYPVEQLLPVLVALNLPLCLYFVMRHRVRIDRPLLTKEILPWMSLGVAAGACLLLWLPAGSLKPGLGLLIVLFSLREILRLVLNSDHTAMTAPVFRFWAAAAGVTHGLYASGGPLLVYAVSKRRLDPGVFRATMMAVWLFFNVFLLVFYGVNGRWTEAAAFSVLVLLPLIPAGIYAGELLHHKIPVRGFWLIVQAVLLLSGVSFLIK